MKVTMLLLITISIMLSVTNTIILLVQYHHTAQEEVVARIKT